MVNHGVGQLTTRHADPFGHTPRHRRPVFEGSAACRRCSVMVERTSAHTHQNSGASGRRFVHQEGPQPTGAWSPMVASDAVRTYDRAWIAAVLTGQWPARQSRTCRT